MNNPFFWLGLSILLVAISLMALLLVAIFTLQELARAARSAEKLLDTLNREIPPTLRDIRVTGKELSGLSDEVTGSVQSARSVVRQVDQGLSEARVQAQKANITTRSVLAGAAAAFRVLAGSPRRRRRPPTRRPPVSPLSAPPARSVSPDAVAAPKLAQKPLEQPVKPLQGEPLRGESPKTGPLEPNSPVHPPMAD